jgi:hypothetical protein
MRLGVDEAGVTELAGVTEHARALATTAAALLLESLDDDTGLVAPLPAGDGDDGVKALLAEAAAWARSAMGRPAVPVVWRILARNPHYLASTWRKDADKRRVALAVAMAGRARYMIEYHAAVLRHGGGGDADLLEVLGVVDHYTTLNTLSDAMQIESDIRPPGA